MSNIQRQRDRQCGTYRFHIYSDVHLSFVSVEILSFDFESCSAACAMLSIGSLINVLLLCEMNMATALVVNVTQTGAQSAGADSLVAEQNMNSSPTSPSTSYLVSTEAALIAAIVVIVILLMIIICLLFRFLPTLYTPKPDPIIKSKRRRKRLKLKPKSKSLSTSSYSVIRLKQNLDTPHNSNQSESRTSLMESRSKSPNTITIMMTPKDDEDAPQTLLADQSSTESNLSLYNMTEPVVTRDISLDVEPSLRLHAQGSNISTVSRSIRTNALSEGHHDHKEMDRQERIDGHKLMDIVVEDQPENATKRTDDGHGIDDINNIGDRTDVTALGGDAEDQDSDTVPLRVLPDIDDRRGDMVGMNQIGDDALDECSDLVPLRIVTNGE